MRRILCILALLALPGLAIPQLIHRHTMLAHRPAPAGGGGGGGNVPPVAGYQLWVHADDSTGLFTNAPAALGAAAPSLTAPVISNGQRVGTWLDRSASGTNNVYCSIRVDGSWDARPIFSNSFLNGKPVLVFDANLGGNGGCNMMTRTNLTSWGSTGLTWFAVVRTINGNFPMVLSLGKNSGTPQFELRKEGTALTYSQWSPNFTVNATASFAPTNFYALGGRSKNGTTGNTSVFKNGSITDVNAVTSSFWPTNLGLAMGSRWAVNNNGLDPQIIAEAIVYPWFMSNLEVSNVNNYLTNKYNLHDP